jgi:hypothetical protein
MKRKTCKSKVAWFVGLSFLAISTFSMNAFAQGCVAAHTEQPLISGLLPHEQEQSHHAGNGLSDKLHNLTLTVGFRTYSSYKHYVGTDYQAQRAALHNEVQNHVNLYDISFNYQLTPRLSIIGDIPALTGTRHQQGNVNVSRVGGIGDITAGVQTWLFRPPTESHGNVALSFSVKLPTGINDASGYTILGNGKSELRPFDQSIQPGDGSWGFSLGTQAYRQTYFRTTLYFTGSWLFNPRDLTGVKSFRSAPHEDVMSATDQYLWRGGLSRSVPKLRNLALSVGGRMEGVPVRDAFGASNGFRRPGYVISIEPGLSYSYRNNVLNVSAPWAMERNRKISTADLQNGKHGDAAFADYTIIASFTRRF